MAQWGVWDFAGGLVVHITAGFSALASLLVVGKRRVLEGHDPAEADTPHDIPMVALGTALLWFGWFGFNGGSALGSGGLAVAAGVNSQLAGAFACAAWMMIDWLRCGKPNLVGMCVGAIAGLATVTPAAGFIQPWGAVCLGLIAAPCCYGLCELRKKFGVDDALDVWPVHGMGGFIGSVLLGVLADPQECLSQAAPEWCVNPGTVARSFEQFGIQLTCSCVLAVYSFVVTFVILTVMNKIYPIIPNDEDLANLDLAMHGCESHTPPKAYELGGRASLSSGNVDVIVDKQI